MMKKKGKGMKEMIPFVRHTPFVRIARRYARTSAGPVLLILRR